MNCAGAISSNSRKKILCLQVMRKFVQLLAIASKENSASPRSVADSDHITLNVGRAEGSGSERLVQSSVTSGNICYGCFVVT